MAGWAGRPGVLAPGSEWDNTGPRAGDEDGAGRNLGGRRADVPEGTAAAGLELTVGCWYQKNGTSGWSFSSQPEQPGDLPPLTQQWEKTYSAAGELLQDGAVLFHIAVEEEPDEGGPRRT